MDDDAFFCRTAMATQGLSTIHNYQSKLFFQSVLIKMFNAKKKLYFEILCGFWWVVFDKYTIVIKSLK